MESQSWRPVWSEAACLASAKCWRRRVVMLADAEHLILVMVTLRDGSGERGEEDQSTRTRPPRCKRFVRPQQGKRSTGPRQKADHQILCAAPGMLRLTRSQPERDICPHRPGCWVASHRSPATSLRTQSLQSPRAWADWSSWALPQPAPRSMTLSQRKTAPAISNRTLPSETRMATIPCAAPITDTATPFSSSEHRCAFRF